MALHRGSAGPALAPPPHETVFFFPASTCIGVLLFFLFSYVFPSLGGGGDALLLWRRSLFVFRCRSRIQETKIGFLRFCLLVDLIVDCFSFCSLRTFLLLDRVTQVYNPSSFAFGGGSGSLSGRRERKRWGEERFIWEREVFGIFC